MSSSRTYFSPGGRSFVRNLIKCRNNVGTNAGNNNAALYSCPRQNNKQALRTAATRVQRRVNAILYAGGGRIVYGDPLGIRTVLAPLRNRF